MNLKEILKDSFAEIKAVAPTLATALGGPTAGIVTSLITSMFGGDADTMAASLQKIPLDPDTVIKLKQLEAQHAEALADVEAHIYELEVGDRQSARQREVEYIKALGRDDSTLRNLAYITTVGFFITLYVLFAQHINLNQTESNVLSILVGMLAGNYQTVINFFFGTSSNERRKGGAK